MLGTPSARLRGQARTWKLFLCWVEGHACDTMAALRVFVLESISARTVAMGGSLPENTLAIGIGEDVQQIHDVKCLTHLWRAAVGAGHGFTSALMEAVVGKLVCVLGYCELYHAPSFGNCARTRGRSVAIRAQAEVFPASTSWYQVVKPASFIASPR